MSAGFIILAALAFFIAPRLTIFVLLLMVLAGCGGGDGGPTNMDRQCAALMDSIHHPELHPYPDWTIARNNLGAKYDPVRVAEYDALKRYNIDWFWMERTACYERAGYVPPWEADKATIARRLAYMAATIEGECVGDETIGEC